MGFIGVLFLPRLQDKWAKTDIAEWSCKPSCLTVKKWNWTTVFVLKYHKPFLLIGIHGQSTCYSDPFSSVYIHTVNKLSYLKRHSYVDACLAVKLDWMQESWRTSSKTQVCFRKIRECAEFAFLWLSVRLDFYGLKVLRVLNNNDGMYDSRCIKILSLQPGWWMC